MVKLQPSDPVSKIYETFYKQAESMWGSPGGGPSSAFQGIRGGISPIPPLSCLCLTTPINVLLTSVSRGSSVRSQNVPTLSQETPEKYTNKTNNYNVRNFEEKFRFKSVR